MLEHEKKVEIKKQKINNYAKNKAPIHNKA